MSTPAPATRSAARRSSTSTAPKRHRPGFTTSSIRPRQSRWRPPGGCGTHLRARGGGAQILFKAIQKRVQQLSESLTTREGLAVCPFLIVPVREGDDDVDHGSDGSRAAFGTAPLQEALLGARLDLADVLSAA